MSKYAKFRGFTLVELLIVIVVIGILSVMMVFSSTEAVSSAKAATIISDLRQLKTAALAYYADNLDEVGASNWPGFDDPATELKVWNYLSTNTADKIQSAHSSGEDDVNYKYSLGGKHGNWFVWCRVYKEDKVRAKLYSRKETLKLVGCNEPHSKVSQDLKLDSSGQHYVGMLIR